MIRPTQPRYTPPDGADRPKPLDEHALLRELWQISHFGWKRAICLSQVDGRGEQPTPGEGKRSTGRRMARARGRDTSSQADARIAHVVVLSLS